MSTLQTLIDRARTLYTIDTAQYTPTQALEDANIIYHQIEDFITTAIGEGFFWDIMYSDTTVVDQSEYRIPVISSGNFNGTPKIEGISICYTDGGDYIPAREVNRQILLQTHDLEWYETNQSEADPIYFIADDSYFVYPAPLEAVTTGIKLYGIKGLVDLEATTTYANIFGGKIPYKYYYMITEGMSQFIHKIKGEMQLSRQAKQAFELETLPSLVEKLGNRKQGISQRGTPNTNKYK